ncbi:hypothetical protein CPB97_004803, partial [Podila verticillata]
MKTTSMDTANDADDSDQDTVKKLPKKKVQQYQGPNGSTLCHLAMHQTEQDQSSPMIPPDMTQDEYTQAIRTSSNKILYDLLAQHDKDIQELTVRQHKVKLLTWKFYCDKYYEGDYTVNTEHMLPYFENLIFLCTSKRYITPDIGYDGIISLRPMAKWTKDVEEWVPESLPEEQDQQDWTTDDADAAIAQSEELKHEVDEVADALDGVSITGSVNSMGMDVKMEETSEDSDSIEISIQEELDTIGTMVEGEDENGIVLEGEGLDSGDHQGELGCVTGTSASPEPHIIETEADKEKVFSGLVPHKDGCIAIIMPLTLGTVDNYHKACIYLWKLQNQRTAPCPNPMSNPHSDGPLDAAINAYGVHLIYDKAVTGTTRNTACDMHNTYD